jgi:hypothetical protein
MRSELQPADYFLAAGHHATAFGKARLTTRITPNVRVNCRARRSFQA